MKFALSYGSMAFVLVTGIASGQAGIQTPGVPRDATRLTTDTKAFTGEVVLDGKRLCSFDSTKAEGVPWRILDKGEAKPSAWVSAGTRPDIVLRLSNDSAPVTLLGPGDSLLQIKSQLERQADSGVPTYNLRFGAPLPPGNYEFAGYEGRRPLFFRCGFTVEN